VTLFAGEVVFDEIRVLKAHEFDGKAIFDVAHDAALSFSDHHYDANGRSQIRRDADRGAVDRMVREAGAALGPIDILVCNASSRGQVDFLDLDYATWRRVIDITLDGTFHCAQATLPGMIAKGWGRIITLGGIAWHAGVKRRAHNLTGKSGLTGLTRALAVEFGDKGITANVISPGAIETARPASAGVSPLRSNMPPVPRTGHVDEIASAALFLAQPRVFQHVDVGADHGQGTSQLMRRVRQEVALGKQHAVHTPDHRVERRVILTVHLPVSGQPR
jgi:3-oxoacyl-[acyl-carrier protein] reductase